jgi:hypothetical protein
MDDPNALIREFQQQSGRHDGAQAVAGISSGLERLSDTLYLRLHQDVERAKGIDSMLAPISETKSLLYTKNEIGIYQVAESAAAVRQFGYWHAENESYVRWLARLSLGESPLGLPHREQIEVYLRQADRARWLAFTDVLAKVLPESRQAPLVLFPLFSLAVQVVTALAFGNRPDAERLRAQQIELLPMIPSCHQCHGQVLDNGACCDGCANPLWKTEWLTSVE